LSTPARWNITDAACICSSGVFERRRARPLGDVRVAGRIDHPAGEDRLPARLGLDDDARDRVGVHDGRDEQAVEHRMNAGLLHQRVGHDLEALRVDLVGERL
jgi:hypothetical protein